MVIQSHVCLVQYVMDGLQHHAEKSYTLQTVPQADALKSSTDKRQKITGLSKKKVIVTFICTIYVKHISIQMFVFLRKQ